MSDILKQLDQVLEQRKQDDPSQSYVASLYDKGLEKILKKIAEESAETLMAAKDIEHNGDKDHLVYEIADLWFHTLVLLASQDLSSNEVTTELQRRFGLSGHEEKANRSK
ncbi:phosphoribosyl-ATP diphosphatase [Thiomicrorhabdus sp. ZW0627]|uniref:phosphoribosyl-ATP diphosphatase n=1 Tax=Thiomicrorhabdus sp. ZW0627 TaxID=3039774 RepID=UPI0024363AD0|nr:phosphoribosyl-ATP diphosphatase [Thiomicrorhabdus sp. ZW0627]MDG6774530.1 phosphoribosyl-ATP diphosphatase [Thiomicrorhabdus sp. ZW0627]